MHRFFTLLVRRRWIALSAAIATAGALAVAVTNLGIDNSLEVWFVDDDPTLVSYRNFLAQFGSDEVVVIGIHGEAEALDPNRLARLSRLTEKLSRLDGVDRVRSLANAVTLARKGTGTVLIPVIDGPVGADDLDRARAVAASGGPSSLLLGSDGKTLVILAWLEESGDLELRRGRIIDEIRLSLSDSIEDTPDTASVGGFGVLYDSLNRATLAEGATFIGLSYLVIVLATYIVLRRFTWTMLALIVVTMADFTLLGTMALLERPVNMITMALPALVMILGVANVVHMSTEIEDTVAAGSTSPSELAASLASVATPCFLNTLTTSAAFLSLTTASMAVTRDYGLFAALGVAFAFVYSVVGMAFVLPRAAGFRPRHRSSARLGRAVEGTMRFSLRHRGAVLMGTVVIAALALLGVSRIVIDTYSIDFLAKDHPYRRESATLEATAGPYIPLELLVRAADAGGWRRSGFLQSLADAQSELEEDPHIGSTTSIGDVLRGAQAAMTGEAVEPTWAPASDAEAAVLVSLVEGAGGAFGFGHLVASDDRTLRLTATTPMASAKQFVEVGNRALRTTSAAMAGAAEVNLSGYIPLYGQMIAHVLSDQVSSFSLAFLTVFLLVGVVLRSWRFTLAAVPPNAIPVAVVLGVMGFAGIRLDIATVTIAAVVLGIIVDDTVHILYRVRRKFAQGGSLEDAVRHAARASGVAVASTSFIFVAGFGVIALAGARSVAYIGFLTALAVGAALLTDVLTLPAVLSYLLGRWKKKTADR